MYLNWLLHFVILRSLCTSRGDSPIVQLRPAGVAAACFPDVPCCLKSLLFPAFVIPWVGLLIRDACKSTQYCIHWCQTGLNQSVRSQSCDDCEAAEPGSDAHCGPGPKKNPVLLVVQSSGASSVSNTTLSWSSEPSQRIIPLAAWLTELTCLQQLQLAAVCYSGEMLLWVLIQHVTNSYMLHFWLFGSISFSCTRPRAEWCTFSHEQRDGMIKHGCRDAGVVGHRVLLHVLEGRELHNLADDLIRDRHVQVPHDALHFAPRILGGGGYNSRRLYITLW